MVEEPFRLGTRGSTLARRQAEIVQASLERHRPDVELVPISTAGDRLPEERIAELGRTGAFVRDLDDRILEEDIDAAVHSLKDMPTKMPEDLIVAAIPERSAPHDVLITPEGANLDALPSGATIGTASLRRRAQLLRDRPDLEIVPLRGNVDTRIEKLLGPHLRQERDAIDDEDERETWMAARSDLERSALERDVDTVLDGIVLAAAGIERIDLGRSVPHVQLPVDTFVPPPGQGAIAVTMRDVDEAAAVHRRLDHPPSRVAATVERVILAEIGGGCIAPIGVHAVVQGEVVHTNVDVRTADGDDGITGRRDLAVERHVAAARAFARDLIDRGAADMIAAATATE